MIIKKATIIGFGKWENKEFSFDSNFQLFYGENEAGKSTIYQFIRGILFGFTSKKKETTNYEPKNGGTYGGSLLVEHPLHGTIKIERIKTSHKGKATLTFEDGNTGDEETLKTILSPLTKELFDEVFSLQQEQLVGINSLNEEKLQRLLLTIGLAGSKSLLEKQEEFYKEQQELYKPTGRKPELNRQLKVYKELKSKIATKEQSEERYQNFLIEAIDYEKELDSLQTEIEKGRVQVKETEQQEELFPKWQERNQLEQVIDYGRNMEMEERELETLRAGYQTYQFLKEQEKKFLSEKNEQIQNSIESPALVFYLEQEQKLVDAVEKQAEVENLTRNKQIYDRMIEEKEREKAQIAQQLAISVETAFFPTLEGVGEIKKLVQEEEKSQINLKESERKFDLELDKKEELEEKISQLRNAPFTSNLIKIAIPLLFFISSIVFFLTGRTRIGFLAIALSLVFFTSSFLGNRNKKGSFENELTRVEMKLEELAEETEKNKKIFQRVLRKKEDISQLYQFSMDKTCQEWLMELTLRERLEHLELEKREFEEKSELEEQELRNYRVELSFAKEWFPVDTLDISALYQQINDFVEEMKQKRVDSKEASEGHSRWSAPIQDVERRKQELVRGMTSTMEKYRISAMEELPIFIQQQEELLKRKSQLSELNSLLEPVFDLSKEYTLEEIQENQLTAYQQLTFLDKEEKHIQKEYQKNKYIIHQMERDGTLQELYQEEANERSKVEELMEQWIGYRLSEAVIQDLLDFLSTQQLPALLSTATAYFKILTNGKYQKCTMEDGKLVVYNKETKVFQLSELSTGTKDQLYLSLRLAFIQLHSQDKLFPVIIDDGWLHYDRTRKHLFFELLDSISKDVQIICFSSDNEIASYFDQREYAVERI